LVKFANTPIADLLKSGKTIQVKFLYPSLSINRGVSGTNRNLVAIIDQNTGLTIAQSRCWVTGNFFSALLVFVRCSRSAFGI
jgi:hypothetical protein